MIIPNAQIDVAIPEGWEFVRVGAPTFGEHCMSLDGASVLHMVNGTATTVRIIVRKSWQWPSWLTAEWIAMDHNGSWWAFSDKPKQSGQSWTWQRGEFEKLHKRMFDFQPPPCDDWKASLRQRPTTETK